MKTIFGTNHHHHHHTNSNNNSSNNSAQTARRTCTCMTIREWVCLTDRLYPLGGLQEFIGVVLVDAFAVLIGDQHLPTHDDAQRSDLMTRATRTHSISHSKTKHTEKQLVQLMVCACK